MLNGLNPAQHQAVTSSSKRICVLAGAGTGKTKTLTSRIAYLNDEHRIGTSGMLALTFTRLAGLEMKERIASLVGEQKAKEMFCNTFHAFCVTALQRYGNRLGLEPNFTIYDPEDQESVVEQVIKDLKVKAKVADVFLDINCFIRGEEKFKSEATRLAATEYKYRLKRNNAISLDELLLRTLILFKQEAVAEYYRESYPYVFVDEFQDTDEIQWEIIQLFRPKNLLVVGDDFQAIYGWRGARVENILEVAEDPAYEVVKLEQNYRSTLPIVDASNSLIKHNTKQTEKVLVTDRPGDPVVTLLDFVNEEQEAAYIADHVMQHRRAGGKFSDVAVLARTNRQLSLVKDKLREGAIPALIISKDSDPLAKPDVQKLLKYIAYMINPSDERSLRSCINFPERRITDLQMSGAEVDAGFGKSLREAMEDQAPKCRNFFNQIDATTRNGDNNSFWSDDAWLVIQGCAFDLGLKDFYTDHSLQNRYEDVRAGLTFAQRWCNQQHAAGERADIQTFMKWIHIRDLQDYYQRDVDAIQLFTIHGSKGLEFDTVIMVGMNQGTFPSKRSMKTDPEEERRLAYVGVTRAKRHLILTRPQTTFGYGKMTEHEPSQYIRELGLAVQV
ncbi:UvrD-helicase domain-containing protein [Tumebacillus sp. ITR2]|uniref:DNA 3'-5' helicase n=1 Tax=Tumebacillus amylolyticus TaxID=2801339 RepID=A0ABS1JC80_9BACL|nr:ATP-dependent helicase [Tumebacillus amylolyticus]MBL0387877.1 UvrD-helicase domain-containing protein [Tumebacillus amylolyticus]